MLRALPLASTQITDVGLTVVAGAPLSVQPAGIHRNAQVFAPISRAAWQDAAALRVSAWTPADDEVRFETIPVSTSMALARSGPGRVGLPDTPLDVLDETGERIPWTDGARETTALIGTGVLAATGYVVLNTRLGLWLLSLLTSQPLWREFDPLEVLYAWEANGRPADGGDADKETLATLVEEW
jgi:hypothetical protein